MAATRTAVRAARSSKPEQARKRRPPSATPANVSTVARTAAAPTKHRIYTIGVGGVYQAYLAKAAKKQRSKAEVDTIIRWLTGYPQRALDTHVARNTPFEAFFAGAPTLNPARSAIKGVICGVRIEAITDPLMKEVRYLDKLIDELAQGKAMPKILRQPEAAANAVRPGATAALRAKATARAKHPVRAKATAHQTAASPIDGYLQTLPADRQTLLQTLRTQIRSIVPNAEECISYGMPAFRIKGGVVAGFQATKTGASYYPFSGTTLATVAAHTRKYSQTKSALHFNAAAPLPLALVRTLITARKNEIAAKG